MSSPDDGWIQEEDGPVSRPYTVTGGRTRSRSTRYFDLVDLVVRRADRTDTGSYSPERSRILSTCRIPISVAELAAGLGLPIGVVRVLLGDLLHDDLIQVVEAAPRGGVITDRGLLSRVLEGLRAL